MHAQQPALPTWICTAWMPSLRFGLTSRAVAGGSWAVLAGVEMLLHGADASVRAACRVRCCRWTRRCRTSRAPSCGHRERWVGNAPHLGHCSRGTAARWMESPCRRSTGAAVACAEWLAHMAAPYTHVLRVHAGHGHASMHGFVGGAEPHARTCRLMHAGYISQADRRGSAAEPRLHHLEKDRGGCVLHAGAGRGQAYAYPSTCTCSGARFRRPLRLGHAMQSVLVRWAPCCSRQSRTP